MPSDTAPHDPPRRRFVDADLSGARFVRSTLAGAVMRAVDVAGADIDAPWLLDGESTLLVNGVDVAPFVDAELDRRFPGREERRAPDPEGLRKAWAAIEGAWAGALDRVETMPRGTADVSVDGEWSFAQTLRHLVMATDTWLGGAVLERAHPYHPLGVPNVEYEKGGNDLSIFSTDQPTYAEVLGVRAGRMAMVRDHLASITVEQLAENRRNPWALDYPQTVLACLHTVLEEEWEHLRFALRDLDAIEAGRT